MAAMTYESIVAAVRKKLSKADVSSIPGTLAFQVDVEGKAEGIFYIEIKDGQLHVEPYDYHDRNARLIIKHQFGTSSQYEKSYNRETHHHQICTQCGKVTEFQNEELQHAIENTKLSRFQLSHYSLYLSLIHI